MKISGSWHSLSIPKVPSSVRRAESTHGHQCGRLGEWGIEVEEGQAVERSQAVECT
jgi:hypothetical protein